MGRRGPAPTPTALKKLRGNPGRRPLNKHEPQPDPAVPECPDWIDDIAKAHWRHIVPQLHAMGVLARIDQDALAAYCKAYARWRNAEEFIQHKGEVYTIKDDNGRVRYVQQWPQVSIAQQMYKTILRLQQEFGLTPSSRSRINVSVVSPVEDEFEEFLRKPKIVGA